METPALLSSILDKSTYLRSGELQYFRIRPALWTPALEKLRAADFLAVSTYVPWILHEYEEGHFDFAGQRGGFTNLVGFLEACRAAGMGVMIRPGPQIYAEFAGFGLPLWLGERYPECVMRDPRGKLVKGSFYYYYTLLHPTYLAKVERWYQQVIALLWPRFADLIISFQLDNETGMPLANTLGHFDANPDTIGRYRAFLEERYQGDIAALNRSWGTHFGVFEAIGAPARPVGQAEAADWYDFFESFVATYLATLRDLAARQGVPVPLVINDLDLFLSPAGPGKKRGIAAIQGYDIYTKGSGKPGVADFPFAPAHDPERFQALLAPDTTFISVELGAGWFDPRARIAPEATLQATLGGIAHGIRGHSYYVAHDGRDPDGSPYTFHSLFDEDGQTTERFKVVTQIHRLLAEHQATILQSQPLYAPILYLTYQPYARLLPGDYLPFSYLLPDPLLYLENLGHAGFYDVLITAGYLPRFADLQQVTDEELAAASVVCFPTRGWVDAASCDKLIRYVARGGHLLTFPTSVTLDDHGHPLEQARLLYPRGISQRRHIGYPTVMRRVVTDFLGKYLLWERGRLQRREPSAIQNMDSFEGLKVLLHQKLPAARLTTPTGMNIRGDYSLTCFSPTPERLAAGDTITDELHAGARCAGYRFAHSDGGSSTVIGTLPGGAYTTGVYYQLAASERANLRQFAREMLSGRGVEPHWTSDLDIECVIRRCDQDSTLLFIFNRLGDQRGLLRLDCSAPAWMEVNVLWSYHGSSATPGTEHTLLLDLRGDDVLVVQLTATAPGV